MQLISTFSFVEISTFFSVIEMYIKMSEISNFWLSVLISQVDPYLMFILVSKSTHPVSLVLSSQNAQCFYISAPLKDVGSIPDRGRTVNDTLLSTVFPLET